MVQGGTSRRERHGDVEWKMAVLYENVTLIRVVMVKDCAGS